MREYQLEVKQVLDYPRIRVYREFIQSLTADRSLRTCGTGHLYHYTVLCSYANFRTSYRRLDGVSYTIRPGEWLFTVSELMTLFRTRFKHQVLSILESLQQLHLITFTSPCHGHLIKYRITGWRKYNTVLDYNCPCQKTTGFFFIAFSIANKLIGVSRPSEMDILLDLWFSTIYNDPQVLGSDLGPVVYFRDGSGSPILSYADLAKRWRRSRSSVGRLLKKLENHGHLSVISFPGRSGSVIYLNTYLSTMFEIPDIIVEKAQVALHLNLHLHVPDELSEENTNPISPHIYVSNCIDCVPKPHIRYLASETLKAIAAQGVSSSGHVPCYIKLYPLSGNCHGNSLRPEHTSLPLRMGMIVFCGRDRPIRRYTLTVHFACPQQNGGNRNDKKTDEQ